jgi:hypothetical protein
MKRTNVVTGVLAVMLMFGSTLTGWSADGDEDSGGILTLTDIPAEYYGKYIALFAADDRTVYIVGANEVDTENLDILIVAIVGERVDIPLWFITDGGDGINADTYAGNDTLDVGIEIASKERASDIEDTVIRFRLEAVTFASGSATASWHDSTPVDE